jgi:hypothetical protein
MTTVKSKARPVSVRVRWVSDEAANHAMFGLLVPGQVVEVAADLAACLVSQPHPWGRFEEVSEGEE